MRFLLACEFYHPSRGGVQEVMRQIAERLAASSHDVTVVTTRLAERDFDTLNGVKIVGFDIRGNRANGLHGEVERYQAFLRSFSADALLIKAAQQWTFDAAWPVFDQLPYRKVFIPCGFSGLYMPEYASYFRALPDILRKFDHLIFYAERYRDVDFAREHGISNFTILPNGASEVEFAIERDPAFREALGIGADDLVVLTVGTPINAKGHTELAAAFAMLDPKGRNLVLILNGHWPEPPPPPVEAKAAPEVPCDEGLAAPIAATTPDLTLPIAVIPVTAPPTRPALTARLGRIRERAITTWRNEGAGPFLARARLWLWYRSTQPLRMGWRATRRLAAGAAYAGRQGKHVILVAAHAVRIKLHELRSTPEPPPSPPEPPPLPPPPPKTIEDYIREAEAQPLKRVLATNLPRPQLIQAFRSADLFVFASNIEYSPLVLFEAGAAGLPYVTVPVGNAEEIVRWTGGGVVCPAPKDEFGYTRVDPAVLANHVQALLDDPEKRHALGRAGRSAWREMYNWKSIVARYERILTEADQDSRLR